MSNSAFNWANVSDLTHALRLDSAHPILSFCCRLTTSALCLCLCLARSLLPALPLLVILCPATCPIK